MIRVKHKGDFKKTQKFLQNASKANIIRELEKCGREGVAALASATPINSGQTASSWGFEIAQTSSGFSIFWTNSNVNDGVNIAIILQYGHGTGTGGYVRGRDYINPAIAPVFDKLADEAWRVVTKS